MVARHFFTPKIVGYQDVSILNGWSLFTPTFKQVGSDAKFDLKDIVPKTPGGATICKKDATVYVKVLGSDGNYGKTYNWQGKSLGGWAEDGKSTIIDDGEVMIGEGWGIAVYNNLYVHKTTGVEMTTAFNAVKTNALFNVNGEVDLVCQNSIINGWQLSGNSTPVAIDLTSIVPKTPLGATICKKDATVYIKLLAKDGNYTTTYNWQGKSLGAWAEDGKSVAISEGDVVLEPGSSFAVYNNLYVHKTTGVEMTTAFNAVKSTAILALPSPVSAE